jgi:integrase/recombinase XerD
MKSIFTRFEAYLVTEKRVAHNTVSAYKTDLAQFQSFLAQNSLELPTITVDDLKKFLQILKKKEISARSMARKISALKIFFSWAHEIEGWPNVAKDLRSPKLEKRLPGYLTEQEIEALFAAAQTQEDTPLSIRNRVMLYLLYVSGMRITELTTLTISQIQFDAGFIRVKGKGNKERLIPLPESMLALLRDYLDKVHSKFEHDHTIKTDLLFPILYAGQIKPISRQSFWLILKQLCIQAGIRTDVSPHKLRHSLATHLLKKGTHLRTLQLLLGHENLSTVEVYTHVETSYVRKVYDKKHPRA